MPWRSGSPYGVRGGLQALVSGASFRVVLPFRAADGGASGSIRIPTTQVRVESVFTGWNGIVASEDGRVVTGWELLQSCLFETQEGAKDPSLSVRIPPRNPEHLAFSDHVCCFDPLNNCPSGSRGPGTHSKQFPRALKQYKNKSKFDLPQSLASKSLNSQLN
jgi:hypothetical protein